MREVHVELAIRGSEEFEPVHTERIGSNLFRVLYSPGLVYGVAAGDEIELLPDKTFRVVHHGFNLAVRVLSPNGVAEFTSDLTEKVEWLGGTLDGRVENGLSFTIPLSAGFGAIERVFGEAVRTYAGLLWEYGNVYDSEGNEMGWWRHVV